jgi:hypothetical protein
MNPFKRLLKFAIEEPEEFFPILIIVVPIGLICAAVFWGTAISMIIALIDGLTQMARGI